MRILVTARSGARDEMLLTDLDDRMSTGDAVQRIAAEVAAPAGTRPSIDGRGIDPEAPVSESGLREGSIVSFDAAAGTEPVEGSVDLCVTGGRGAGGAARLGPGETLLQVDGDGRMRLDVPEPDASVPTLAVTVGFDGAVQVHRVPDPRSASQPTTHDGTDLLGDGRVPWPFGSHLDIGASTLTVQQAAPADADLRKSGDPGHLDYNRPPRLLPPMPPTRFRLPAPPRPPTRNPLPWLAAALPAVIGVVTAAIFNSPAFLLLALASPLMVVGNWWMARRNGVTSHRVAIREHSAERAAVAAELRDAVRREQLLSRVSSPGAAELRRMATTPTRRLWERRTSDPDHLAVRLGLADAPSRIEAEDSAEPEHRRRLPSRMTSVPVTVSLRDAGVLGIAGAAGWPRERARWIVGQLAVLQSPRDVRIIVLGSSDTIDDWSWAAWLPHLRPAGQEALALLGASAETLAARVAELGALLAERRAARDDTSLRATEFTPEVVVVLDGARRLRALPGVVAILRDGPELGIRVVCLDGDERQLPEECTAVALARADGGMLLRRTGADDVRSIRVDEVGDDWFGEIARAIAPVRDVSAAESEGLIPEAARLVEVLGLSELAPDSAAARWSGGRGSTEAVVGVSLDGPFALDLVRDGPHALVAGTTGSGKSEFLQTVVASLAVVNSPRTMNFVLVDYKGGAAFSQCELLPHTVGMVTDLDAHLVERALESLRAELTHREHVLAAAAAKDLEDYLDAQRRGHAGPDLPRLVIVIDEFAAMAKELPDFVAGLVNIAQRGRSLGIHLILATQRPSGVISPEIRANTNLRVALRMTDRSESSDVIDSPEAAQILKSQPGRAFARLGHASLIPFQTARVGGRRLVAQEAVEMDPPFIARIGVSALGDAAPQRPVMAQRSGVDTDLSAVVAALRGAAELSGEPVPRRPWLPPLPGLLALDDVAAPESETAIPWGLEDDPAAQRQAAAQFDLDEIGHSYVVGAPGSGRSTVLRTMAAAAARRRSPADLHLYAIDCGNGALAVLDELPHCGAVVPRAQSERATRLLQRIKAELARRQAVLARGNHADATEQRLHAPAGERLPHILLLIDRWEGFVATLGELDGGTLVDLVHELLRDGASAGIHLLVSGDRSLLSSRMSTLTDDMVLLRMTDRYDYGMAGIDHRKIPDQVAPGRGFRSGSGREVQAAVLGSDPSGRGQTDAVRALAASMTPASALAPGSGPFRVDDLPTSIDIDGAYAYAGPDAARPLWAMVGVGGDQLAAIGVDLARTPAFLIAGPSRSGKSTLLHVMAESLLRGGTQLVVAAPRVSSLRELEGRAGVRAVLTGSELADDDLAPHLEPDGSPVALVVDDGELLADAPAKAWLRSFLRTASDQQRCLVLAGDIGQVAGGFSGWQVDVKKYRHGALLSPQSPLDGDLVGVRLPRSSVSSQVVPGRALVHRGDGELLSVLVPTVGALRPLPT